MYLDDSAGGTIGETAIKDDMVTPPENQIYDGVPLIGITPAWLHGFSRPGMTQTRRHPTTSQPGEQNKLERLTTIVGLSLLCAIVFIDVVVWIELNDRPVGPSCCPRLLG